MSKTTTPYRCDLQRRPVIVVRLYQEAGGIGEDDIAQVLVGARCSHAPACPDRHRCPLRDE
ncbi:hypothetical protein ACXZ1M_20375 [Duganella sp. PWIR1]